MPRRVFRRNGVVLGVDTSALDRAVARFDEQGIAAAREVVADAVRDQYQIAYREWGVETGEGRASLQITEAQVGQSFVVRIFSRHRAVKWQAFSNKPPSFWSVLVARPLRKLAKLLAKRAAAAAAGTMKPTAKVNRGIPKRR